MAERKIPVTDGLEENDQAVLRAMTLYDDQNKQGRKSPVLCDR
jgi:hypothetical protein